MPRKETVSSHSVRKLDTTSYPQRVKGRTRSFKPLLQNLTSISRFASFAPFDPAEALSRRHPRGDRAPSPSPCACIDPRSRCEFRALPLRTRLARERSSGTTHHNSCSLPLFRSRRKGRTCGSPFQHATSAVARGGDSNERGLGGGEGVSPIQVLRCMLTVPLARDH